MYCCSHLFKKWSNKVDDEQCVVQLKDDFHLTLTANILWLIDCYP